MICQPMIEGLKGLGSWLQVSNAFQRFGAAPTDPSTRALFLNACNTSDPNIFLSTQARYCQPDGEGELRNGSET